MYVTYVTINESNKIHIGDTFYIYPAYNIFYIHSSHFSTHHNYWNIRSLIIDLSNLMAVQVDDVGTTFNEYRFNSQNICLPIIRNLSASNRKYWNLRFSISNSTIRSVELVKIIECESFASRTNCRTIFRRIESLWDPIKWIARTTRELKYKYTKVEK